MLFIKTSSPNCICNDRNHLLLQIVDKNNINDLMTHVIIEVL